MKKLFFSSIALVAFSSISMGNTIRAEQEITIDINTIESETIAADYWSCANIAVNVYNQLIKHFSAEEARDNANAYFEDCMTPPATAPCNPPFLCR